jgi:circadian clock protein KaiC
MEDALNALHLDELTKDASPKASAAAAEPSAVAEPSGPEEAILTPEAAVSPVEAAVSPVETAVPAAQEPETSSERVHTHIRGFDEALNGGIPKGFVVIVEGAPGTMKSTLAFWTLAKNATNGGARGLYLSCEESTASLLRQMRSLGVSLEGAEDRVTILDSGRLAKILRHKSGDWLAGLKETLEDVGKGAPLGLLVIDSVTALEAIAKFDDRRRELFRLFEWLRDLGATTIVIAERPDYVIGGHVFQGQYDEDFLADGVIHLRLHLLSDVDVQRRIRVVKMRGTKHETGYLALHVGDGQLEVARVLGG